MLYGFGMCLASGKADKDEKVHICVKQVPHISMNCLFAWLAGLFIKWSLGLTSYLPV